MLPTHPQPYQNTAAKTAFRKEAEARKVSKDIRKSLVNRLRCRWQWRTAFLSWPVDALTERLGPIRDEPPFRGSFAPSRYPFGAMRYWWVSCALAEEARRVGRPLTILDAGCGPGKLRSFMGHSVPGRWLALDRRPDALRLAGLGYEEVYQGDLDQFLPLPDQSLDIVVLLHVIEHLPRPPFTMAELARILRPGGVFLGGSPIAPAWVAPLRQWRHQRLLRQGIKKPGDHIHSFWPGRWRRLVAEAGLTLELMNGLFFYRSKGSPLENWRWWVRLNHLWGALFPSLGSELYLLARK